MPRAVWSGAISFGLVTVPVKLYSAVHDHAVHFHQVDKSTKSRIRYEKVAEKTGKEVDSDDIELGYEVHPGKLVVVDPDEIEQLRPKTTRTVDISDFVDLAAIDPVFYNRTYWLAPDGEAAQRPYRLLLAAMEDRNRVGIGTLVMRNKQYLAAVRPRDGALALSTMRFADEVVDASDISGIPKKAKVDARELKLAEQIIDALKSEWKPDRYQDTYTDDVRELLEKKAEGEEIEVEPEPEAAGEVVDLMAALEASLEAARGGKRTTAKKSSRRKPAARKSA